MEKLIAVYQERLNLKDANFVRIDHHDAMVGIVYNVIDANGSQYVLKICTRAEDYFRETYFLKYFAENLPVPRIYQMIPPERNLHGAILMEHLSGRLLEKNDLSEEISYGSLFARIHQNQQSVYGDLIKPDELSTDPRIHFTQKFEEELAECDGYLPKKLLNQCRDFHEKHINLLSNVDGPCIIHRDFRPGNILIDKGKIQGVIDWSSARSGFAEEDFCRTGLEEEPFDSKSKDAFLTGYSSIRPIPNYSKIMPILKLSRAIAIVGFCVKQGTWNTSHIALYQLNLDFLQSIF